MSYKNPGFDKALAEVTKEETVRLNVNVPASLYYDYKKLAVAQRIAITEAILNHMRLKVKRNADLLE